MRCASLGGRDSLHNGTEYRKNETIGKIEAGSRCRAASLSISKLAARRKEGCPGETLQTVGGRISTSHVPQPRLVDSQARQISASRLVSSMRAKTLFQEEFSGEKNGQNREVE